MHNNLYLVVHSLVTDFYLQAYTFLQGIAVFLFFILSVNTLVCFIEC